MIMKRIVFVALITLFLIIVGIGTYLLLSERQPSITTVAVAVFAEDSAIVGGTVKDADNKSYTEFGIVFDIASNPTISNNKVSASNLENGKFEVKISNLKPSTRYYARAYAMSNKGTIYASQIRFVTTAIPNASYILDDDTAEANFSYFGNFALGNQFNTGEDGVITSIDVYGKHRADNLNHQVIIDIYNADRRLLGSSAPFLLASDAWVNVAITNLQYSGTFYAMVRWSAAEIGTHGLGYDTSGMLASAGLNWVRDNNGSWWLLHEAVENQYAQGVFMIRANVQTEGTGTVADAEVGRLPILSASAITRVTASAATIVASIESAGFPAYNERGIVYCTHANPVVSCQKIVAPGTALGRFTVNINELRPNTEYYARAYAINAEGIAYGNQTTFKTPEQTDLPALTTSVAAGVTASSATFSGNVLNAGIPAYSERGFVYCTHSIPLITCSKVAVVGSGLGNFNTVVTTLRAGTTYYVRSYATNASGTYYGNETVFTTPEATEAPSRALELPFPIHQFDEFY
jgi:hypothetical protein